MYLWFRRYQNEQHLFYDKSAYSTQIGHLSSRKGAASKRLVIHLDKGPVHTSRASPEWLEEHGICQIPYQPDFPDLASSNFYLFFTIKETLERIGLGGEEEFFEGVQAISRDLDQQELNSLSQAWVRRVQKIIESNGDYVR
jgi:hypothetical protein